MTEQSTKDFLISRQGRPILIGAIIAIAIFGGIGYYSYSKLFPDTSPREREITAEQRAGAGDTRIKTSARDISPNLTSPNLSNEGRSALTEFNRKADEEGRMSPPTPDDVLEIEVETTEPVPQVAAPRRITAQEREVDRDLRRRKSELERERLEVEAERRATKLAIAQDYRQRRLASANDLIGLYSEPASVNGMALNGASGGGSGLKKPAVVTAGANGSTFTNEGAGGTGSGSASGMCESPLIKGGEIRYAQSDIALNTDFKGPVRMTFLDGNLQGFIGMGSFELNELGAKMKLRIDRLFDQDGQSYSVSGYVLDPETTLWAMASDVDRHIIYRYGGYGLGTIMSAFAILADNRSQQSQIISPQGAVATQTRDPDGKQVTWTMAGEFSRLFEESFRDNINRPITVTLDPEEEAGVLFEDTVCEVQTDITKKRRDRERRASEGLIDPLATSF